MVGPVSGRLTNKTGGIDVAQPKPTRKRTAQIDGCCARCEPVKSRHVQYNSACPLYIQKRTFAVQLRMSAKGQKRTKAVEGRLHKKSSPPQGKVKGFFKISGEPAATASISSSLVSECRVSKAAIQFALLVAAFLVSSAPAFAKGGGNGAGIAKPPGYTGHRGAGAGIAKPPG